MRATGSTVAPSWAKPRQEASPIPDAAPVTSATFPSIRGRSAGHPGRRRRTPRPTLLYPSAMLRSSAVSTTFAMFIRSGRPCARDEPEALGQKWDHGAFDVLRAAEDECLAERRRRQRAEAVLAADLIGQQGNRD